MNDQQVQDIKNNPTPQSLKRVPGALPRNILYMAHGSADGKYPCKPRSAVITDVHDSDNQIIKVCVLNPTGIFFTHWLEIQYPDMPDYGKGGTVFWPVYQG